MKNKYLFNKLKQHIGHNIELVGYGKNKKPPYQNIAIECIDDNEVLIDIDN